MSSQKNIKSPDDRNKRELKATHPYSSWEAGGPRGIDGLGVKTHRSERKVLSPLKPEDEIHAPTHQRANILLATVT